MYKKASFRSVGKARRGLLRRALFLARCGERCGDPRRARYGRCRPGRGCLQTRDFAGVVGWANAPAPVSIATRTLRRVLPTRISHRRTAWAKSPDTVARWIMV